MLLPSTIRQTQYTDAPQLRRWICLYWMSAIIFILVLMAILMFNEVHVLVDDTHKKNNEVAQAAVIFGTLICIFCGFLSKYNIMNPIGVTFVTILTLFVLPSLCMYGCIMTGHGKSREVNVDPMNYINELKRVWEAEHRIPDWMTTAQRYIECCGVKSYKDYRIYIYGNYSKVPDFPQSCCAIRKWEWFYKDPKPLDYLCNENVFDLDTVTRNDYRSPYQKMIEEKFYGNVQVPLESNGVNFNKLYFKGCENVLVETTKKSFGATYMLLLVMGFWSLVLFAIHIVRFTKFLEKSVKTEKEGVKYIGDNDIVVERFNDSDEEVSSAESFQEEINRKVNRVHRAAQISKTSSKSIAPREFTTVFSTLPLSTKGSKYASEESDSFDEADTNELKLKRGSSRPRTRFEFLVTVNGKEIENEVSKHYAIEDTSGKMAYPPSIAEIPTEGKKTVFNIQ